MSKEINCQEPNCKQAASQQIHVVLRSRPGIPVEVSNPLGFICEAHKAKQSMDEFVSETAWQNVVFGFRKEGKTPPVRTVSYLVIKPITKL